MYREFLLDRFDKCDNYTASVQFRSLKYAIFNISGETSHNTPLYNYKFGTLDEKVVIYTRSFDVDALSLGIRYAYGEKIFKNGNFVYTTSSNFPVIWFKYTRGLTGIINGEYEFDRILFRFDKSFYIKYLGKPSIRIDMGYVNGNLPLFLLFSSKASYRFFNLDVPYTFATARINEFTCDRFLSVYFQHDFGKLIFGRGKFSPSPVLISSFGLGTINNKENHLNVNIKTMEKGFFESGIMINSLLSTGICNMGIGGYYRYGYYGYSNFIDNLSIRVSITFPFLQ
jgi:hypothetical protein